MFAVTPFIRLSELIDHDTLTYQTETKRICDSIDLENIPAEKYNCMLLEVLKEINSLASWTDFVSHGGLRYGLPHVLDDIHRGDDCMGTIITTAVECECNRCDNGYGCGSGRGSNWSTEKSCDRCSYQG